jgi:hypothetical protein
MYLAARSRCRNRRQQTKASGNRRGRLANPASCACITKRRPGSQNTILGKFDWRDSAWAVSPHPSHPAPHSGPLALQARIPPLPRPPSALPAANWFIQRTSILWHRRRGMLRRQEAIRRKRQVRGSAAATADSWAWAPLVFGRVTACLDHQFASFTLRGPWKALVNRRP